MVRYCQKQNKPVFEINLLEILKQKQVNFNRWVVENHITVLNVSGPRESETPVYDSTFTLLMELLSQLKMWLVSNIMSILFGNLLRGSAYN